jgi:phosphate transport system substrate-binding protein
MKPGLYFLICIIVILIISCGLQNDYTKNDTPTSGRLKLFCDQEIIAPVEWQAFTFQKIYPNAIVNVSGCYEASGIKALFNDSTDCVFLQRNLSAEEQKQFEKANIRITQVAVAGSAFVVIADTLSPMDKISTEELVNTNFPLLFHGRQSSAALYLRDSLLNKKELPQNWSAKESIDSLLAYLHLNSNALAVINYSLISDSDDPKHKALKKKIKIIPVSHVKDTVAYYPDQSNIKTGDYPLSRKLWMIRRSGDFTLATGFVAFIAGEKGQVFFTKLGFSPEFQRPRNIVINPGYE